MKVIYEIDEHKGICNSLQELAEIIYLNGGKKYKVQILEGRKKRNLIAPERRELEKQLEYLRTDNIFKDIKLFLEKLEGGSSNEV